MIQINYLEKHFINKNLFKDINPKFSKGNNYRIITAKWCMKIHFSKNPKWWCWIKQSKYYNWKNKRIGDKDSLIYPGNPNKYIKENI